MALPLLAIAKYFALPKIAGGLADQAALARYESLANQGKDPSDDLLLNALQLVPRQSTFESAIDAAKQIYNWNTTPPSAQEYEYVPEDKGYQVTRELPYDQGVEFLTPMEDFLKYGGRDDDAGGYVYPEASYGQTDQPATAVYFDDQLIDPISGSFGEEGAIANRKIQERGGFARGGLADLLRAIYAKHQR